MSNTLLISSRVESKARVSSLLDVAIAAKVVRKNWYL